MPQHFDSTFAKLKGRILTEVERENSSSIILRFAEGESCSINVEGDCCSSSWFYEFEVCALPAEITGADQYVNDDATDSENVAKAKCEKQDSDQYWDEQSVWDVVLTTTTGELRLRHINVSNGYYDGMVTLNPSQSEDWV